jgi:hypothetical protein
MRPALFLASYPRSGNTFMRALLGNYHSGLGQPLSAQAVAVFGLGEQNEAVWRSVTGVAPEARTVEQQWMARDAYFDRLRETPGDGPIIVKTHTLNGEAFGRASFRLGPEDRIVYLVRHPFDVLLSAAAFFGHTLEAMADRMRLNGAFNRSPPDRGVYEITGSWRENVSGWLTETRAPLMLIRYDELIEAPEATLRRVLAFGGWTPDRARVTEAVAFSQFDILRRSTEIAGFDQGEGRDPRAEFFRVGRNGQWRTEAPLALQQALAAEFGDLMTVLGFEQGDAATEAA